MLLGHSLTRSKWTWWVFFPKICSLTPSPPPSTIRHERVYKKNISKRKRIDCISKKCNAMLSLASKELTIHKIQILKRFPWDKINGTKNALFFLLRAPTHHSFTFNWRLLYELKQKVCLSKTVCGVFHFRFRFVFIKVCIFVQQNAWTLWL